MIKAAIFDMDGLLIDSEPFWEKTTYETYAGLGIKLTPEDIGIMMGRRIDENATYLYKRYGWEGQTVEEVVNGMIDKMIKLVKDGGVLKPGVDQVLQLCKKAGFRVAIASSSRQRLIDAVVDTLEIREHFHHIYSAQFEDYGKPHPAVFLSVAKHFEVEPYECLVFEDSPSGVLAAKAAGMKCVAVPESPYRDNKFVRTADIIIASLEEFNEASLKSL